MPNTGTANLAVSEIAILPASSEVMGEWGRVRSGGDGSPIVDPGLDEVQIVAVDEAQHRMPAGHGAAERRMRLAALGFDFGLGGGRRGEQGSAVEEDSVDDEKRWI